MVSNLLRERGYQYKVAFGCSLPDVKAVAKELGTMQLSESGKDLAESLWADTAIRESMMIAPMLYPRGEMDIPTAEHWAEACPTAEIADLLVMYVLQFIKDQDGNCPLIAMWQDSPVKMLRYCSRALNKRLNDVQE